MPPLDPETSLEVFLDAWRLRQAFVRLVESGFTEDQALKLIAYMVRRDPPAGSDVPG